MVDINGWKQKQVIEKLGVTPSEAKEYRDGFLELGTHWGKIGVTIYWTDHALWMFKKHLVAPAAEKNEVEVFILGPAMNPRFVYGNLDGTRVAVECPHKFSQKILKKKVTVLVTEQNGEPYYSYNP